jgi:hypothetical protein
MRLKKGQKSQIDWDSIAHDLIQNRDAYHAYYYSYNNFTGPSHYFHTRALSTSGNQQIEMLYAMLVSWGMHRMGGGAQMSDYPIFYHNINLISEALNKLKGKKLDELIDRDLNELQAIFINSTLMKSSKKIVAMSKILAHIIPEIFVPIDNEYTFQLISNKQGVKRLPANWTEFEMFKELHLKLFKPIVSNEAFRASADDWIKNKNRFIWDTSIPKIVDNLIIGKIGHSKKLSKMSA